MLSRRIFRAYAVLAAVSGLLCAVAPAGAAGDVKLTLLFTNDVHGHLLPFGYDDLGGAVTDVGGVARRATLIRKIKAEAASHVLVLDAGDSFQRGPLRDLNGEPDFAVMNAVPYDVMALGNNEFKASGGPEALAILKDRLREAKFAVVCANVFDPATNQRLVQPYKIFTLGGIRVAVLGLLTSDDRDLPQFSGLRVDDPIVTARLMVPELRRQADYVIALTHVGFAEDLRLASQVSGLDVIVGGHSHTWLFQPVLIKRAGAGGIGGTIVCADGEWGRTLGRLDLKLTPVKDKGCVTSAYQGKLLNVDSSIAAAADVEAIVEKTARPYRTDVCKLTMDVPIRSAADWTAERMREAASSDVAVLPRDDVEQGLNRGRVTALDIKGMFPFNNVIDKLTITGNQLRRFVLSKPDCALAGAAWSADGLLVGGRKVGDAQTYTAAVEDYFAQNSPELIASPCASLGRTTGDIVTQYLFFHYSRN